MTLLSCSQRCNGTSWFTKWPQDLTYGSACLHTLQLHHLHGCEGKIKSTALAILLRAFFHILGTCMECLKVSSGSADFAARTSPAALLACSRPDVKISLQRLPPLPVPSVSGHESACQPCRSISTVYYRWVPLLKPPTTTAVLLTGSFPFSKRSRAWKTEADGTAHVAEASFSRATDCSMVESTNPATPVLHRRHPQHSDKEHRTLLSVCSS